MLSQTRQPQQAKVRDNPRMQGLHLSAEFHGCDPHCPAMTDVATLQGLCEVAVHTAGLQRVGAAFHGFGAIKRAGDGSAPTSAPPGGVTGVVLLAESHLAVHTWPEFGSVTVDVYVCNVHVDRSAAARTVLAQLRASFAPRTVTERATPRDAVRSSA